MDQSSTTGRSDFYPKGALAFFASMAVFYAGVWLALYGLLLRQR